MPRRRCAASQQARKLMHTSIFLIVSPPHRPPCSPPACRLRLQWSWPFNAPVDLRQYPDYGLMVTNPMDFGSVKKRIDTGRCWRRGLGCGGSTEQALPAGRRPCTPISHAGRAAAAAWTPAAAHCCSPRRSLLLPHAARASQASTATPTSSCPMCGLCLTMRGCTTSRAATCTSWPTRCRCAAAVCAGVAQRRVRRLVGAGV